MKSLNQEIFHIKAMLPYWDVGMGAIDEKSPYRVIAIRPDTSLQELGACVVESFGFDCDHLFGFYDNFRVYYKSTVSYEFPDMFDDDPNYDDSGSTKVYNLEKHTAKDIFTRKEKKWLMLFDYGDQWTFWLHLEDRVSIEPKKQYPAIVESRYDAPEQYAEFEDDDYDYDDD